MNSSWKATARVMAWAVLGLFAVTPRVHGQLATSGNDIALYYLQAHSIQARYIRPMATHYISTTDMMVDWLLDGVILYDINLYISWHPQQSTCDAYINNLFAASNQVSVLNTLIGGLKTQLGSPAYKWKVVLTVPVAEDVKTGTNTVANCTALWNQWQSLNPTNLELSGFYWGYDEQMSDSATMDICRATADYIHAKGLKLFWIPYNWAPGVSNWASYRMDYVTQQPNYIATVPAYPNDFANVNTDIINWGLHGAELEFQSVRSGLSAIQSGHDYLDYAEFYRWNDLFLTTYYEQDIFDKFARHDAIQGRAIYDRLYRYISPTVRAQWRFSETSGATVYDSSCHTNNATLHGTTRVAEGIGSALRFNGTTDYLECPDDSSLDITGNLTLEAWVKPESLPVDYAQIVGRTSGTNRMLLRSDGAIVVQMGASSQATAGSVIVPNQWYHLVYTSNGTNSTICVNGVAVATGSGGANFSSTDTVRVGKSSSTYPLKGVIDEVKIYSRALTLAEAFLDYQEGLDRLNLRGGWSFEEGTGTSAYDCSVTTPPAGVVYGARWVNDAAGGTGTALRFNGTSTNYVEIPDNTALDVTGGLSLEAWIKPEAFPATYAHIVGRSAFDQRMILKTNGAIRVEMGGSFHETVANAVALNQWNHLVYTSNGTNSLIYVNGVQSGPTGSCGANFSASVPIRLGKGSGDNYPFKGIIDEVRVYARALTAAEVLTRYSPTLMGRWSCNEGAGTKAADTSGHANDGTVYGGTTWSAGVNPAWMVGTDSGSALHFNGVATDYVETPANAALDITGFLTLEAWIRPEAFVAPYAQVVGRSASDQRLLLKTNGAIRVEMGGGTFHETAANAVALSNWSHLVYTSNGTNSLIYVNGVPVGSAGTGGANFNSTAAVRIGKGIGDTCPFKGLIDEISVYNCLLSPAQVSQRYSPFLRAQWRFNEGTGVTASDTSGHNNTGAITGATWLNPGINYVLYFDGGTSDYVEIPDSSSLAISCNLTLEAWIKPESVPSSFAQIVGRSAYGQRMLLEGNGAILVQMGNSHETPASAVSIGGTNWSHVVYTSDGVTSYIYVNGAQVGSAGTGGADFRSPAPVRVGKTIGNYYPFKGTMDEVNVYAVALSAADVVTRYRAGRGADPYPASSLPTITTQPQSQTLIGGSTALFAVAAASTTPVTYQWRLGIGNLAGATNTSVALTNLNRPLSGVYSVIVSNSVGSTASSNAVLRVLVPQRLSGMEMLPAGTFQFGFRDSDGNSLSLADAANFEIRASTNLADWLPLTNGLSLSNGFLLFRETEQANSERRFYRVVEH